MLSKTLKMMTHNNILRTFETMISFIKMLLSIKKSKTVIGNVASGTDFAPATKLGIQIYEIGNVTINEANGISALNAVYLSIKFEEINLEVNDKVS